MFPFGILLLRDAVRKCSTTCRLVSVHLSVTLVRCILMAKLIIRLFPRPNIFILLLNRTESTRTHKKEKQ